MGSSLNSASIFLPDVGGHFSVDEAVFQFLPHGTKVLDAVTWGTSAWTKTAKITTELADGTAKTYFLKATSYLGAEMMEGEFNSLSTLSSVIPSIAPKPYGWGKFSMSDSYFLIMDFLELKITLPDPGKFTSLLVDLHRKSSSPTGKFGFHIPTCHGKNLQLNKWTSSWTECFSALINAFYKEDMEANGSWPDYERAFDTLRSKVVPRLLDALQANGRQIKPCLVHGDLWEENVGINLDTGNITLFDASCMYAHNEYELGMWRREIIRFGQPYFRQYLMRMPPSEPTEEWDDRNLLYSIKFNLSHASHWPGSSVQTRDKLYEDVCYLNNKYCPETAASVGENMLDKAMPAHAGGGVSSGLD